MEVLKWSTSTSELYWSAVNVLSQVIEWIMWPEIKGTHSLVGVRLRIMSGGRWSQWESGYLCSGFWTNENPRTTSLQFADRHLIGWHSTWAYVRLSARPRHVGKANKEVKNERGGNLKRSRLVCELDCHSDSLTSRLLYPHSTMAQ